MEETKKPRAMLRVNEIYNAFQGEGVTIGKPCTFLRLCYCNLRCFFCDSWFAWNYTDKKADGIQTADPAVEVHDMTLDDIVGELVGLKTERLVISGGEPLVQREMVGNLISVWRERMGDGVRPAVEIETNGTIPPTVELAAKVDQFNVSPKLASSGNPESLRYKPEVLRMLEKTRKANFKFVVSSMDDMAEIERIVAECGLTDVVLMAEGKTKEEQEARQALVAGYAMGKGWRFTPRLHVLLFGNRRGV